VLRGRHNTYARHQVLHLDHAPDLLAALIVPGFLPMVV
jgi:hypothetical protein